MRWLQSGLFRRFMMVIGTLALLPIAFLSHEIVKLSALLEEPAAPRRAPPADFAARTDPRRACDAGDGKACDYLGWMHAEGQGAPKDDARAIVLFGKACDLGVGRACGELGDRYAKGRGVKKDRAKAVEPYRKGCELKEGWACQCLGFLHASGWGTPKNPARAVQLYWEACGLGDVVGCQLLGWTYASGEGVPKDEAKAAKAYRIACDKGDGFSCNGLGVLYGAGQGLAKDEARAFQLYRKACELNDGSGCVSLGVAFVDGRGVKKDEEKGLELYRKACDMGNGHGCGSLGWMYTHGVGTAKDEVRAAEFYRQGCDKGDRDACGVPGREEPAAPSGPRCQAADMEPPPESAKGFRRRTLAPANPGFQVSVGAESPCGRATKPWVYQLEVEDLAGAKTSLSRAFESARAAPLPKGCQIEAQWLPGMDKLADNYSETRWVHRANLERFEREVLAMGTLQVSLDAFAGREDTFLQPYGIPESELVEYERLLAEERAEAAYADPVKRRMRGDRIRELEPRAERVRCTRHSELTQVQLVLPLRHARRGLDLRTTRAAVAPAVTRRPFSYGGAEEARRAMERFK